MAGTKSEFCEDNRSIGNASNSFREDGSERCGSRVRFSLVGADDLTKSRAPGARPESSTERVDALSSPFCATYFRNFARETSPAALVRSTKPGRESFCPFSSFCNTISRSLSESSFLKLAVALAKRKAEAISTISSCDRKDGRTNAFLGR